MVLDFLRLIKFYVEGKASFRPLFGMVSQGQVLNQVQVLGLLLSDA